MNIEQTRASVGSLVMSHDCGHKLLPWQSCIYGITPHGPYRLKQVTKGGMCILEGREGFRVRPKLIKPMNKEPSPQARRAAELCFGQFCSKPVQPSKDRIPELAAIIERETGVGFATHLLKRIIDDLPQKRDWLDPTLEREARAFLDRGKPH